MNQYGKPEKTETTKQIRNIVNNVEKTVPLPGNSQTSIRNILSAIYL